MSGFGHRAPSDKLNIAVIGIGGMGNSNLKHVSPTENIVALCDVDDVLAAPVYKKYPNAKTYRDFRVMLEKQKDIDAVIVATPDHSHAVIAMAAGDAGARPFLRARSDLVSLVECGDTGSPDDVDTPEDLARLKDRGLAGVEVYTSYHSPEQTKRYAAVPRVSSWTRQEASGASTRPTLKTSTSSTFSSISMLVALKK